MLRCPASRQQRARNTKPRLIITARPDEREREREREADVRQHQLTFPRLSTLYRDWKGRTDFARFIWRALTSWMASPRTRVIRWKMIAESWPQREDAKTQSRTYPWPMLRMQGHWQRICTGTGRYAVKGCTTDIKSPDVTKSETSNWGRGDPRDIHKQLQIVRSAFIDYAHNVARRLYVDINFYLLVALKDHRQRIPKKLL